MPSAPMTTGVPLTVAPDATTRPVAAAVPGAPPALTAARVDTESISSGPAGARGPVPEAQRWMTPPPPPAVAGDETAATAIPPDEYDVPCAATSAVGWSVQVAVRVIPAGVAVD